MNIITVIPISRSKIAPELSYFTSADVPLGAIVSVPLRSKKIHAIVIASEPAKDIKINIKRAGFEIRKLDKVNATVFFPPSFIAVCKDIATYYATTVGAVIDGLVSNTLLENADTIMPPLPPQATLSIPAGSTGTPRPNEPTGGRVYAVQGDDEDRLSSWRSLIRQEFARKRSVVFYVPTIEDCDKLFKSLEKGIEEYIFMLNGNLVEKKIMSVWKSISETEHPIVIIATGLFPLLPRGDIDTVVIERENGRGWISQRAPYMDLRRALVAIYRTKRGNIYLSDSLLRTETLYKAENEAIEAGTPFKWRSISTAHDVLVDMKRKTPTETDEKAKKKFRVFSLELESLIRTNREESTHLFVLTLRRGTATTTVCNDCETIVLCRNCSTPVVLHTSAESGKNFFMCHICGERRNANETCVNCGSWNLTPLGIGIDRVLEEIKAVFPGIDVFKVDADTTKNEKQIKEVMDKFKAKPGSILLGTELAVPYIGERIEHVAIVSLDTLFALPDFRMQEKIMYTLVRLRSQATRSILVQTRRAEQKVFEYGLKGNLSDFFRLTLEDRKKFDYPPYSVLVKITIEGEKEEIASNMAEIAAHLLPKELDIFPAFTATIRGKSVIHGLMKIPASSWPDMEVVSKLRLLPPNVSVKIDPESLL